jgi:ABC-2 type transport system ATP-binding protein/lipopolysaccharide transport system ATP-binding protein
MANRRKISVDLQSVVIAYRRQEYRTTSFKEYLFNQLRGRGKVQNMVAVDHVSFSIEQGESVGLIGHNGSGKSSLLKAMAGIIRPVSGTVNVVGRIAPMIELGAGFDVELSGLENIYLSCTMMGLGYEEIVMLQDSIIRFAELESHINLPVKNYSSGMQARLGFACATAVTPDLLIVDEVLSVGDSNFGAKCLKRILELKQLGTTIVLVSHDIGTVRAFCDKAAVLNDGKLVFFGDCEAAIAQHQAVMEQRFIESLSVQERFEFDRQKRLKESANLDGSPRPSVSATIELIQDGRAVERLELTKEFCLKIALKIRRPELIEGAVNVGYGLSDANGRRLAGTNIARFGVAISKESLMNDSQQSVLFEFPDGLSLLAPGRFLLQAGVLDRDNSRTLLDHSPALAFLGLHGGQEFNADGDVIESSALGSLLPMVIGSGRGGSGFQ